MAWKRELAAARERWNVLTFYEKFEHAVIVVLTGVIALIIVFALWSLVLKVAVSILESSFDPTDYSVFQALFGMIFTVIIALEFKRSLLVVAERDGGDEVREVELADGALDAEGGVPLRVGVPRQGDEAFRADEFASEAVGAGLREF